jgi:NADH:ubiquinone oxidoreductase subunit F (NADH-binding)
MKELKSINAGQASTDHLQRRMADLETEYEELKQVLIRNN